MEIRNESLTYIYTFNFIESSKSGESPQLTEVLNGSPNNDLLAVSGLLSCTVSFPATFLDQNNEICQRNIKHFSELLEVCLLNKRGLKVSEKTVSNSCSTHEPKSETTPRNR